MNRRSFLKRTGGGVAAYAALNWEALVKLPEHWPLEWDVGAMRLTKNAPVATKISGGNFPLALNFDPIVNEEIYIFGKMPGSKLYKATQDINIEISWIVDATFNGTVRWEIYLIARSNGKAWPVDFTDSTDGDSVRTPENILQVLTLTMLEPSLSPGDDFILKGKRVASHINDTYPADAGLVRVRMYAA